MGDHLLLSEVVVAGAGEYIEIYNPTGQTIALDDYYLSDDQEYALLPGATGAGPAPTIANNDDFIIRFPAGATIAPRGVLVITTVTATAFETAYGFAPDYSIQDGDMVTLFGDSSPTLTNGGEMVALFYWDGATDTVMDVDLMIVGSPNAGNMLTTKTGVSVDGPDADTTPTAYLSDAFTIAAQSAAPATNESTKRIALEDGLETMSGGNGITGNDETTEATATTWDTTYSAPTPGDVPASINP